MPTARAQVARQSSGTHRPKPVRQQLAPFARWSHLSRRHARLVMYQTDEPESIVRCAASLAGIGLPGMRLDVVVELIAGLPFEPCMAYLGPVAAAVHHADDPAAQLGIAERMLAGPILEGLRGFVAESPNHLVFDERYIAALQRLLVENARDVAGDHLSEHERATLLACLLAMGDVLPDDASLGDHEIGERDLDAWLAYTVRGGAYYDQPYIVEAIARAYATLAQIAREPDLRDHPDFCPLDEWAADGGSGGDLADQLSAGIALAVGARALQADVSLEDRLARIETGFLRDTAAAQRESMIFSAISADRDQLRRAFRSADRNANALGWDHTPFEQRPFLRRHDGGLLLTSPRALTSWLTRGLYFRMLDAAKARRRLDRPDQDLGMRFLAFGGPLAERYVLRLVMDAHRTAIRAGGAVVSGEQRYTVAKQTFMSPDVALAQPPDLVFFEVYSGRIPLEARVGGATSDVKRALRKMIINKLEELQRRISDALNGRFTVEGMPDGGPLQVWPMLVLAGEGVLQTPLLWRWIRSQLEHRAFGDARVRPITICDLDDLEPLLALVERGHTLPELLAHRSQGAYAQLPPRNWVGAVHGLAADTRPRYVEQRFEDAMQRMRGTLFPTLNRSASDVANPGADNLVG